MLPNRCALAGAVLFYHEYTTSIPSLCASRSPYTKVVDYVNGLYAIQILLGQAIQSRLGGQYSEIGSYMPINTAIDLSNGTWM